MQIAELILLIDLLYEGAVDPSRWEMAIGEITRRVGGDSAAWALHDMQTFGLRAGVFINIENEYSVAYPTLATAPDMASVWQVLAASGTNRVLTEDTFQAGGLNKTRFDVEWLRPQRIDRIMVALLAPLRATAGGLFIGRVARRGKFCIEEIEALRVLQPHLLRASEVRLHLRGADMVARQALEALDNLELGIVLLDGQARVYHASRVAEFILGDGLKVAGGMLTCDHPDDNRRLLRLVGETMTASVARPGAMLVVRRPSARRPLSVLVAPLRNRDTWPRGPVAIVIVTDPERAVPAREEELRLLYGLTPAEARTAVALVDAANLGEVADKLSVSLTTVRTLLQRAFDKTDTHRQSELIRLMMAHRLPAAADR